MSLKRCSRREFLISTGSAGISASVLATVPAMPRRRLESTRRKLSLAVIGLGEAGIVYCKAAGRCSSLTLSAICDLDSARLERAYRYVSSKSVLPAASPAELFSDPSVDALVLAKSGTNLPEDVILEAAKSGKHLFFDDPLALDPAKGTAILRATLESSAFAEQATKGVPEHVFDELCHMKSQRHGTVEFADAVALVISPKDIQNHEVLTHLDLSRRLLNVQLPRTVSATWTKVWPDHSSYLAILNYTDTKKLRLEVRLIRKQPGVDLHTTKFRTPTSAVAISWDPVRFNELLLAARLDRFSHSIKNGVASGLMTPLGEAYISMLTMALIEKSLESGRPINSSSQLKQWQVPLGYVEGVV